ncbi:ParB N-terminal domain-containing protein [Clostridiaceae bacterium M8S5]|nr:ParB N-terminal domain-containing protein [Clostridiaceae bacterium M8S5]
MKKNETKKVKPFMAIFGEDYDPNAVEDDTSQTKLKISHLVPFDNHPFKLYEGERLKEMVESIRQFGVIVPIVVRKQKLRYQILSGHNRVEVCKELDIKEIPAVIKEGLTEEEAMLIVTETNTMQRSFTDLPHSERATVIAVRHKAMKKQGVRTDLLKEIEKLSKSPNGYGDPTSAPLGRKLESREKVGAEYNLSKNSVSRYLRIATLPNHFKVLVDTGQISIRAGVDLSYLKPESLDIVHAIITEKNYKIDMKRARSLRGADKKTPLTFDSALAIIKGEIKESDTETKKKTPKYWSNIFPKYFKYEQKEDEVQSIIEKALELYYQTMDATKEEVSAEGLEM